MKKNYMKAKIYHWNFSKYYYACIPAFIFPNHYICVGHLLGSYSSWENIFTGSKPSKKLVSVPNETSKSITTTKKNKLKEKLAKDANK